MVLPQSLVLPPLFRTLARSQVPLHPGRVPHLQRVRPTGYLAGAWYDPRLRPLKIRGPGAVPQDRPEGSWTARSRNNLDVTTGAGRESARGLLLLLLLRKCHSLKLLLRHAAGHAVCHHSGDLGLLPAVVACRRGRRLDRRVGGRLGRVVALAVHRVDLGRRRRRYLHVEFVHKVDERVPDPGVLVKNRGRGPVPFLPFELFLPIHPLDAVSARLGVR